MKFKNIPRTKRASYSTHVSWGYIEETLDHYSKRDLAHLDLDPDFQRGHVWTIEQKTAYLEFGLMGGTSGKDIYFNCPGWMGDFRGPFVLVDGKQRIDAVREFLKNRVPIFGHFFSEFEDKMPPFSGEGCFTFHVNNLETRAEVLQWYLALNTGGTIHTKEEIEKVKLLLEAEKPE